MKGKNLFSYMETRPDQILFITMKDTPPFLTMYKKEKIQIKTLDDFIKEQKISRIDFLKIDVEGHEYKVINGCIESLKNGMIKTIQFEYNNYWLKSGAKLLEMLKFLESYNYKFYRLTPWGKIRIKNFASDLENYKHSNYIAFLNDK